jgi:hypothetical protein
VLKRVANQARTKLRFAQCWLLCVTVRGHSLILRHAVSPPAR